MTKLPTPTTLDLELEEDWLTIWFNQPEKRNALTDGLRGDLMEVLTAIRGDRAVRGITLRGRGGVFCAGGDLKHFRSDFQSEAGLDDVRAMSRAGAELFDAVHSAPQVVVAIIEGAAVAGGFGLMCCADVVIAASDTKFAMTETAIGLSPAQIAPFVIERIGRARARRMMVTGERVDAEQALAIGLVDYLADDAAGLATNEAKLRRRILHCAPEAVAGTKGLINQIAGLDRPAVVEAAADLFAAQMLGAEAREGIASFLDKRPPSWAPKKEER